MNEALQAVVAALRLINPLAKSLGNLIDEASTAPAIQNATQERTNLNPVDTQENGSATGGRKNYVILDSVEFELRGPPPSPFLPTKRLPDYLPNGRLPDHPAYTDYDPEYHGHFDYAYKRWVPDPPPQDKAEEAWIRDREAFEGQDGTDEQVEPQNFEAAAAEEPDLPTLPATTYAG